MAISVRQIRFYDYSSKKNFPADLTYNDLVNGMKILNTAEEETAVKVGIQAPPGTRFTLGGGVSNGQAITIGATGIYEINLQNLGQSIKEIHIEGASLDMINANPNASLIIDLIITS